MRFKINKDATGTFYLLIRSSFFKKWRLPTQHEVNTAQLSNPKYMQLTVYSRSKVFAHVRSALEILRLCYARSQNVMGQKILETKA